MRAFFKNRRIRRMSGYEYAQYLKDNQILHSIGEHCYIDPSVNIPDPHLVALGSNVRISACVSLFGHDGSVNMLNRAYGTKLDAVGDIVICDNVFIGHGSLIGRRVCIGANTIIGMGSVVTRSIEGDGVWAGTPARRIRSMAGHVDVMETENAALPWRHIIEARDGGFDPSVEPELKAARVEYYFGGSAA